jgi:PKD repeat protein
VPASIAFFEAANTGLGVNAGIVITTGEVNTLAQAASNFSSGQNGAAGDSDLESLVSMPSFDGAVLEFDILVVDPGDLDFQYVFGSEEYPEYVNSSFNDVFAFFVNDPGGPLNNIAMVPGASLPVAINNVNDGENAQYYVNNEAGQHIVFDGLTTVLPATFTATGNQTYHVKIGVTDVADHIFDSGVFIGIQSLCGDSLLTPPADALFVVDGGTVQFQNQSRYATSWHWDFGDGTTSGERHPTPHTYAANGTYTVTLTTQNWCCSDTYTFDVVIEGALAAGEAEDKPFVLTPNPAPGFVTLQGDGSETFDYSLFDARGVSSKTGSLANSGERLNLDDIQPGVYFLILKNGKKTYRERIVVR